MFTSIAVLVGLVFVAFCLFMVLGVAGMAALRGKKPTKAKTEDKSIWQHSYPVQQSYRDQIKAEKAEAVAKLYLELNDKQFIDETIADAQKLFSTVKPLAVE